MPHGIIRTASHRFSSLSPPLNASSPAPADQLGTTPSVTLSSTPTWTSIAPIHRPNLGWDSSPACWMWPSCAFASVTQHSPHTSTAWVYWEDRRSLHSTVPTLPLPPSTTMQPISRPERKHLRPAHSAGGGGHPRWHTTSRHPPHLRHP